MSSISKAFSFNSTIEKYNKKWKEYETNKAERKDAADYNQKIEKYNAAVLAFTKASNSQALTEDEIKTLKSAEALDKRRAPVTTCELTRNSFLYQSNLRPKPFTIPNAELYPDVKSDVRQVN